jgi:hypothetical protein
MMGALEATALAARLCCVARAISLLELAASTKEMRPGGILNWSVAGLVDFSAHTAVRFRLEALIGRIPRRVFTALLLLDAVVVTALFIFPTNSALLIASALLLLIQMKRHYMSYDGADEMIFLCLIALFVGRIMDASRIAVFFLAAEASLAYLVAGMYKAFSPYWKKGQALLLITRTNLFGQEDVARILQRHLAVTRNFEFVFVLWESTFPIALVAPPKLLVLILAVGLIFHISCAWVMGLNTFLWAFAATYPCVIYANQELRSLLSPNTSLYLMAGLIVGIGSVLALLAVGVPRKRPLNDYGFGITKAAK